MTSDVDDENGDSVDKVVDHVDGPGAVRRSRPDLLGKKPKGKKRGRKTKEEKTQAQLLIEEREQALPLNGLLSPRQRKLCLYAARGLSNREISKEIGYSESRISILLKDPHIIEEIVRVRDRVYETPIADQLRNMGQAALNELLTCLNDRTNRYTPTHKQDAAKFIIEKVDGKSVQKHDIGENLLSVVMDKLDAMKDVGEVPQHRPPRMLELVNGPDYENSSPEQIAKSEEELLLDWVTDNMGTPKRS